MIRVLLRSLVEAGTDNIDVAYVVEVGFPGFGVTCGAADECLCDVIEDPGAVGFARSVATESAVGGSTIPKTPVIHFAHSGCIC